MGGTAHAARSVCVFCAVFLAVGSLPAFSAETVSFPSKSNRSGTPVVTLTGELSKPKGKGPFPAVVVLPNCGGPKTIEFTEIWPRYLNELGYATLTVDHFTPYKAEKCTKRFKPKMKDITQHAYGALDFLAGRDDIDRARVAVFGSSLGAHAILYFAGLGKKNADGLTFSGGVGIYPAHCKRLSPSPAMFPLMIVQGDQEKGADTCKRLPEHPALNVTILPNTYHGFDKPRAKRRKNGSLKADLYGNKVLYSIPATQRAKTLVKAFLAERLATPSGNNAPQPSRLGSVGGKDPYRAVNRRDTDGDGKVSRSEWEKSPKIFARIDANGDGFVTPQEFHAHWVRRRK